MENKVLFNTIMENLLISGTKACAVIPRELMSIDPAYQRLETRNNQKITAMHNNFDHMVMDALLVVPHPEEFSFSIVDGYGRFMASKGILDSLECVVITTAPVNSDERRKFEARIFTKQSLYTEKVTPLQMHNANLILENPIALGLQEVLDAYDLAIQGCRGQRKAGIVGSYNRAWNIVKKSGKVAFRLIIDVCYKAGYTMEANGLSSTILDSLYKIYVFYGEIGLRKLIEIMRATDPETLKAKGLAAYPERSVMSLALYLQDYLVSTGEARKFDDRGKKIM